ncbi:MAG: ATPase [Betaproteobacteria bacterium]|nr:ATPase [Betaproteobacteria bacterium]
MKIAILGAESTGKSTLCNALAASMREAGADVVVVDEYLREWCATRMRTPQAHEQAAIAHEQTRRIQATESVTVIADTTALMTAIYSDVLFQDPSHYAQGLEDIRRFHHVLVTATDLPWEADRHFRDSPEGQQAIHLRLQEVLREHGVAYSMVYGSGEQRTLAALAMVMPLQANSNAESETYNRWMAQCEKCSDAKCEHRVFRRLTGG